MRTTRTVKGLKLGFDWQGGTYVDVCIGEAFTSRTFDVINVEDAQGDRPAFTRTNFSAIVSEWVRSYPPSELLEDLRNGGII